MLVAGIGNIFLSDDGFGVEVANRLTATPAPEGVKVADYGIRGLHLAYELLEGYDVVVLVDTVSRGDPPGTVSVLELDGDPEGEAIPDAHDMNPQTVLALLADMGGRIDRLLLVGCEPADLREGMGLSDQVEVAVSDAVRMVNELIEAETSALTSGPGGRSTSTGREN